MARIPKDEIDRIKREVSIERLVEAHGIELKRHGKDLIGRCPWHKDKTPSFVVTPETNLFHCMGACNFGGSVFDFAMKAHGISFREAYEMLKSGQVPAAPARPVKHASIPRLPAPVAFTADDQALRNQVAAYYHDTLKDSPEALAYLKSRGLASPEIIERFGLGFANRTLGFRLPGKNRHAGAQIRTQLERIGILRESGAEHLNGSLVIPIKDERGNVLGMYGRKITPNLRPGTAQHLYLRGDHRGVFNIQALELYPEIILCEALIDAITFLSAGFQNVTSSYGSGGFTPDHWEAFRRYKTKRVLIAYDRDDAGESAAEALALELMAAGIECFRIQFPRGMDANEYALKVQPAAKSLGLVIRMAGWMGKGPAPARDGDAPIVEVINPPLAPSPLTTPVPPAQTPTAAPPVVPARSAPAPVVRDARSAPRPSQVPANGPASIAPQPASPQPPAPPPASASTNPPAVAAPPASPLPPGPPPALPLERDGPDIRVVLGDRQYRIRGLEKNVDVGQLKVNVLVTQGDRFHVDSLDLYLARPRTAYSREAGLELGVADDIIKKELGRILCALEGTQDEQRKAALAPKVSAVDIPPEERDAALELLRDPRFLERVLEDFLRCGVVGEEINLLVGYLAGSSRNLENPVAVVIQSSSAAGKSSLMDAILAFMPCEHRVKYSAMTGQSLFYMGETNLKNKVLAIVEEEGAERASYALKLLQSEGELTIASTGKDPATGRHVTHEYHVEGPVMIFLTTTSVQIDEELLNRCIVLSVNEDREQTRIIHQVQREGQTLEGQLTRRGGSRIRKLHQNAQRLLRPLLVANDYAPQLTFRDDKTRMRRDHGKYLTLIRTVALVHQYQRPIRTVDRDGQKLEYIQVTPDDIRVANRLANEVLGRTLDELPPQTRRLLERLYAWVMSECERLSMPWCEFRFQRSHVRALGWSDTRGRAHLDKLVELEYVVVHRGTRGQTFVYELVYDGQGTDGQPFLLGLIDPDTLPASCGYDGKFAGSGPEFAAPKGEFAGGSPTHRLPIAPGSPGGVSAVKAAPDPGSNGRASKSPENTVLETGAPKIVSYSHDDEPAARANTRKPLPEPL